MSQIGKETYNIFSFSHKFSKGLFLRVMKTGSSLGKGEETTIQML